MRVNRLRLQVNVSSGQSFDHLPLDARSGHQCLDRPVRHGESVNECLRLYTVKPDKAGGVRFEARNVSDDIMRNHVALYEPLSEDRKSCAIAILRASRTIQLSQELADSLLREGRRRERDAFGDQASNLSLVLESSGPLGNERSEIGATESGKKSVECARLLRVVDCAQARPAFEDESERSPYAVMLERLYNALNIIRDIGVRCSAREDPRPSIVERDPGLEPIGALRSVRHRPNDSPFASPFATSNLETGLTPCA